MKLTVYGGAQEVGRNCFLLEEGKKRLLLDCGIKLGEKVEYPIITDKELKGVKDICVSHAHLDHSGYLPHVFEKGFSPRINGTKPTHDLMEILLADYKRIGEGVTFSQKNLNDIKKKFKTHEFGDWFRAGGFHAVSYNAGHILGSAMFLVEEGKRLLYTGDISVRGTRLLDGCERGLPAEVVVIEGTYGDEELPSTKESVSRIIKEINETLKEGGHVLIPSFAVGRGQEVLILLESYMRSGLIPEVPIYMDGMIKKAMRIYRQNSIYCKDEIKRRILMSEDDPFKSRHFHIPRRKDKRDVFKEPSIIVSTSGMLSGGPALGYLKHMAPNPKNKLIFVGYQAEGTLGAKILAGEKKPEIDGEEVELKLKVREVRLSGHSGKSEVVQFIKGMKTLETVVLIHGDQKALENISEALGKDYNVVIPKEGETLKL